MSSTEQSVISSLLMDRSEPIGNSADTFARRAAHTKVGNLPTEAIPVYETGPGVFFQAQGVTDPGVDHVILSGTFTTKTLLSQLVVVCRSESKVTMLVDGQIVASLRTGPAGPNPSFVWPSKRFFPASAVFQVIIKSRAQSPINDCEAFIMGLSQP